MKFLSCLLIKFEQAKTIYFMREFRLLLMLSFLINLSCAKTNSQMIDKTTVKELDLNRYLGTWYEIARFPHSFEKNLVGVTATYSLRDDGKIRVLNQGYKNTLDGKISVAEGKAKIPNKLEPAKLKVSFFWIFYADYFVLELDENYQYAIIGSSSDKYFWILCRTPQMDSATYEMLLEKARKRGYNLEKLYKVPQKTN
jgi:apolipoprotein D and lipocalin family protein